MGNKPSYLQKRLVASPFFGGVATTSENDLKQPISPPMEK